MESIFRSVCEKKIINSGFLYGPFCPIYGFGAIIMILFLDIFKSNLIVLFIMSVLILSLWEYIVGWLLEKIFKTKYWDYSEHKFNIKGRVCLTNSIAWGVIGIIFTKYLNAFVFNWIFKIPTNINIIILVVASVYLLIDTIISVINMGTLKNNIEKLSEIGKNLKEKIEELKQTTGNIAMKQIKKSDIEKKIEELKVQQQKLKEKLIRRTTRIKEAFPTMKPNFITEFLNQRKIEDKRRNK